MRRPDVRVIVAPKQDLQPFTLTEISAIVQKFRSDPYLKHYADYVEFKFGVAREHRGSSSIAMATLGVAESRYECPRNGNIVKFQVMY